MRMWNPVTFELEVANFGTFPQDETNFYKKVASPLFVEIRLATFLQRRTQYRESRSLLLCAAGVQGLGSRVEV